jgi:hypothetical protein
MEDEVSFEAAVGEAQAAIELGKSLAPLHEAIVPGAQSREKSQPTT